MLTDGGYSVVRVKATTHLGRSHAHAVQLAGLMLHVVVNLEAASGIPGAEYTLSYLCEERTGGTQCRFLSVNCRSLAGWSTHFGVCRVRTDQCGVPYEPERRVQPG